MRPRTSVTSLLLGVFFMAVGAAGQNNVAPAAPPDGGKFPGIENAESNTRDGFGSLAVRGVQGTPGGPDIQNVHVVVDLVSRSMPVQTLEGELDEFGVIVFDDIELNQGVQPIVKIHYADVTYQQPGAIMDAAHPQQMLDVLCYEVTAAVPEWRISMWHVMLSHEPGGLRVTKVAVIENPANETWIGVASGTERPTTVAFPVPKEARDLQLGKGFHGWCCTTALTGGLVNHLPLMPETTELSFSYMLPSTDGQTTFDLIAPAYIEHMMLIVPDDVDLKPIDSLALGGTEVIADTSVRYYIGSELHQGNRVHLALTGLSSSIAQVTGETDI